MDPFTILGVQASTGKAVAALAAAAGLGVVVTLAIKSDDIDTPEYKKKREERSERMKEVMAMVEKNAAQISDLRSQVSKMTGHQEEMSKQLEVLGKKT